MGKLLTSLGNPLVMTESFATSKFVCRNCLQPWWTVLISTRCWIWSASWSTVPLANLLAAVMIGEDQEPRCSSDNSERWHGPGGCPVMTGVTASEKDNVCLAVCFGWFEWVQWRLFSVDVGYAWFMITHYQPLFTTIHHYQAISHHSSPQLHNYPP